MSKRVLEILKSKFGDDIYETHSQFGDDTAVVNPQRWREIARFLRDDPQCAMNMFVDLTAVDYLGRQTPRFEVVLHVHSLERSHRIRLKARIGDDDANGVEIDSVVSVWKGANWFERECFDMFGVNFKGHPDLRRILMYPEFVGYPLRKDYPADKTQPLVELRNVPDKLPPFSTDEGMPFGRQTHDYPRGEETN
ncbi:NADH-quinone oxidoreductase subunit C [Polyangium sp. y55x31]|uniref:NADH-quinone oxidoreductase subunit C n=1 Tax=Polyangium sp. y55x31 TaxID=3042688 RepID=UPI002482CE80|nr:NADH-quinone oxidoreductase subunit C [Polyangium sp. y55x31]MDI1478122.1 NADH-quinone oxidoreductase subunit C [Polyangium sp. y55x31]